MKHVLTVGILSLSACASDGGGEKCPFTRTDGLCTASVTIDPREPDSPEEATTLEVRWEWKGEIDVEPRSVVYHMPAQEAAWRKEAWEELDTSRCTIEQPVAGCDAAPRIVFVEAEP